jgi:Na+/H+ antiporter NhaB
LILSASGKGEDMTLVIILNVVLCTAVIVGVVAPLVWAIITQHHHETVVVATNRGTRQVPATAVDRRQAAERRRRRRLYDPTVWPVR